MARVPEVTGVLTSDVCDGNLRIRLNVSLFVSDRDGYGGGREPRGYMERPSTGSYRDPYDGYGKIKPLSVVKRVQGLHSNRLFCAWKGLPCVIAKKVEASNAASFQPECSNQKSHQQGIPCKLFFCPPKSLSFQ